LSGTLDQMSIRIAVQTGVSRIYKVASLEAAVNSFSSSGSGGRQASFLSSSSSSRSNSYLCNQPKPSFPEENFDRNRLCFPCWLPRLHFHTRTLWILRCFFDWKRISSSCGLLRQDLIMFKHTSFKIKVNWITRTVIVNKEI
jgi:hypothetical protein